MDGNALVPFVDDDAADEEDLEQALVPVVGGRGGAGRRGGRAHTKATEKRARNAAVKGANGSADGAKPRGKSAKCVFALFLW